MKVFKFGGASVKDADAVRNIGEILAKYSDEKLIVVISAMGKMTNSFERLVEAYVANENTSIELLEIRSFHQAIIEDLMTEPGPITAVDALFDELEFKLSQAPGDRFDFEYDSIVSYGELLSTTLVNHFLHSAGIACEWLDVRNVIKTDANHRQARIDWVRSKSAAYIVEGYLNQDKINAVITQGFIGQSHLGTTTTLGREGSDFSAAILAHLVNADSMHIWKDAPGMMNADPKFFNNVKRLPKLSYKEAAELSYFGASVIHPKTIKPLQNKDIPLYVRSFIDPSSPGTIIHSDASEDHITPSYILKSDQVLITISSREFSFMAEGQLRDIFEFFANNKITVNLMQSSALNCSVLIDDDQRRLESITTSLGHAFEVRYNRGVKLVTIRNNDESTANSLKLGHQILIEQRTRNTLRFAMRDELENQG